MSKRKACYIPRNNTKQREVFDTDLLEEGAAVKVLHHTGESYKALIVTSSMDLLQLYKVGKTNQAELVEVYLEDYIAGSWGIRVLH